MDKQSFLDEIKMLLNSDGAERKVICVIADNTIRKELSKQYFDIYIDMNYEQVLVCRHDVNGTIKSVNWLVGFVDVEECIETIINDENNIKVEHVFNVLTFSPKLFDVKLFKVCGKVNPYIHQFCYDNPPSESVK